MAKKKTKKDPVQHEKDYIEYLEKQIAWYSQQDNIHAVQKKLELKQKLAKARLILKLLTSG